MRAITAVALSAWRPYTGALARRVVDGRWRGALALLAVLAVIAAGAAAARFAWEQAELRKVRETGAHRLVAVVENLRASVAREAHLPLMLALDPDVQATLVEPGATRIDALNRKLATIGAAAGVAALYVMDPAGDTVAASNWNQPGSFVGQHYGFRPYFRDAVANGRGGYFGIGVTTGRAGYFLSRAVVTDELVGVAVAKVEFGEQEAVWQGAREHVLVTDRHGIVFLASEAHWKYRKLAALDDAMRAEIERSQQYAGAALDLLPATRLASGALGEVVRIDDPPDGRLYLEQSAELAELGWTVHQFTDLDGVMAARRDGALIGGIASALVIAIGLYLRQRRRTRAAERRARVQLEERVVARTRELREANAQLQGEIEERRRAEAELRSAQDDLLQAGRLAALGQMSAAIAHEINQPLAAMRTYAASGRVLLERGQAGEVGANLHAIGDLAERMARITAHLKTFARKDDPGAGGAVDAARAAERALELVEARARDAGVEIVRQIAAGAWTAGSEIRLEQVVVNLLNNALDAVGSQPGARVELVVQRAARVRIEVRDNGPGFAAGQIGQIFDPFYTTKPVGEGLGLGLSITYGIVRDWGGSIRAANRAGGGAEMVVLLPRCTPPGVGEENHE
ncbi:sensor histidine kinase [Pseudothauera nasutitermitis]|uniref:sensor histidine kinase n=1 Tax=Pseudothauera nasutitermitis TaxID=2565930 RepID=UPI001454D819|nr:ATP-binding protein [Pseudothauera nasutitermitis]